MRTKTYTQQLRHERHEVSAFLADLRNDSRWRGEVTRSELQSGIPGQSGAEYLESVVAEGVRTHVKLATPEVEPGSRLVVATRESGYESVYEYQFVPIDGGTELTLFMTVETTGSLRLVESLIWSRITHWVERDLARLDEVLPDGEGPILVSAADAGPDEDIYDTSGQTSRAFLGEVLDNLSEAILLFSADGRIFYANRAVEEKLGFPTGSVLGRRYDDPTFKVRTLDGRELSADDMPVAEVLRSGRAIAGFEYEIQVAEGPSLMVSGNIVPLLVEGRLAGTSVSLTDITERVRTERALKESEERFRAIVDQATYGIVISSVSGQVLVYNQAMERINGVPFSEIAEKGWLVAAFPDPADRQRVAESFSKSIRGELPYLEAPYTRPDGKRIWVSYSTSPVRVRGEDYLFTIASDITERRQAQERVRFQARLLEVVRNAILATDLQGTITFVNDDAVQLFGRGSEELLGANVMAVLRPRAETGPQGVMTEAQSVGRWEGEATFVRADGTAAPILLTIGLIVDEQGRREGYVSVAVDISEIKAAEKALEEKDRAIRQAYVDVVGAVTGGKLVLVTPDELDDVLGEPLAEERELKAEGLSACRHEVIDAMEHARTSADPSTAIVGFAEAATNALKHAHEGWYRLYRRDGTLQVTVTDHGPGIDFTHLPKATLLSGYSSSQTLGMGFSIMLELADRVLLATEPGLTEVVLEFATS